MADAIGFLQCYSQLINAACHDICRCRQVTEIIRPNFQNDAVIMSAFQNILQSTFLTNIMVGLLFSSIQREDRNRPTEDEKLSRGRIRYVRSEHSQLESKTDLE